MASYCCLRRLTIVLTGLVSPLAFAIGDHQLALSNQTPTLIAYTNANLVSAPGELKPKSTVVVNNGLIVSINKDIPTGAKVIDLDGKFIYPGFIDIYTQYGLDWQYDFDDHDHPQYQIDRYGKRYPNTAVHSEMRWAEQFNADKDSAKKWLTNGFTSVQSAWQDGIFQGQGFVASLTQDSNQTEIYKNHSGSWLSFDKGSSPQEYPQSVMGSMALIRQVLAESKWYQQQQSKPQLEINQSLAALTQFEQHPAFFKGSHPDDILRAAPLLNNDNAVYVGTGLEFERLAQLKTIKPQLVLPLTFAQKPSVDSVFDADDLSLTQLRHWERSPNNPAAVAAAGLDFAFTQNGIKPKQFWPRLRRAINHGLSKQDALAALTTTPASFLGLEQQLGKIAPGYRADMVISAGDLFAGGHIDAVIIQGQWQQIAPEGFSLIGEWSIEWQDNPLQMVLFSEKGKLKGQFEQGESVVKLTNIHADASQLSFKFSTSEFGQDNTATVTLLGDKQQLSGHALVSDGSTVSLTAQRQVKATDDAEVEQPEPLLSRQTSPNVAFGLAEQPKQQNLHIRNATVWTSGKQGILANTDVLVRNGKIDKVGQNLKTPSGYRSVDASGKHLTAGIIDEHSHIAVHGGVNEGSDNITSEVRIGDVLEPADIHIYRSLAGGVTTAQLLHGSANPIGGQSQTIKLRWGEDAEGLKFTQAPPSIKFALGENVKQSNWGDNYVSRYPQTRMGVEALMRDGFQRALNYRRAQSDYDDLSRSAKKRTVAPKPSERLDTVLEVLDSKRHIHIHSYVQSEILMMLDLAKEMDFKVQTFTHILEGYKVADELAAAGSGASTFADWWAYKFEVYDAIPHNACLLAEQGVVTSVNSDSRDLIRRLNQEAAKSIAYCGMSQEEAWKMVTINPAKQLKVDHLVGSIESGKQADLVLWSDNPLSVYARAETTWIEGKPYFDIQRDQQEQQAIQAERKALLEKLLNDPTPAGSGEKLTPAPTPEWHCDTMGQHGHHSHHAH